MRGSGSTLLRALAFDSSGDRRVEGAVMFSRQQRNGGPCMGADHLLGPTRAWRSLHVTHLA